MALGEASDPIYLIIQPLTKCRRSSTLAVLVFVLVNIFLNPHTVSARSIALTKRAAFYIANGTVCNVDGVIYQNNEKIPTDNPCEVCYCRPPGFACVLKDCELKPHCKAVRREGQCCPDYHCDGCEHDGQFFSDGQVIPNTGSPCYTCYCQGSSISCSLVSCSFRNDCAARYNPGECCPRYEHCPPKDVNTTETLQPARLPTTLFQSRLAKFKSRTTFKAQLPGAPVGTSGQILIHHNGLEFVPTSPPPVRPTLYFTGFTTPERENEIDNNNNNNNSQSSVGTIRQFTLSGRVPLFSNTAPDDGHNHNEGTLTSHISGGDLDITGRPQAITAIPRITTETPASTTIQIPTSLEPSAHTAVDKISVRVDGHENETSGSGNLHHRRTTNTLQPEMTVSTITTTAVTTLTTMPPAPSTPSVTTTATTPTTTTLTTTTSTTSSPVNTTSTTPTRISTTTMKTTAPLRPSEPVTSVATPLTSKQQESNSDSSLGNPLKTVDVPEENIHRIDDVTHKLTAVTKSIYNKASSASPGTIEDWELEEFRRAVELLETHYRNFYGRAQNLPAGAATHANANKIPPTPSNLRRRDSLPILDQDMIDALFTDENPPAQVSQKPTTPIAQTTSRPPKGPQLKTSDGLEDLIIPEQMPLLGPGDTELRSEISKNTTEKDIEQFLRATLEEDDQRRKAIAIEGPGQSINGSANGAGSPTESSAEKPVQTISTEVTTSHPSTELPPLGSSNETTTPTVLDGDETFHELMQPSIVAAVGVSRALEAKGDGANVARKVALPSPHHFILRSDDDVPDRLSGQTSSSVQASCNLTGQLAGLLDTLSRTSRSHDPVLDFLKRAIRSHAIMHPDDVRTFMKAKESNSQPVYQANTLPKASDKAHFLPNVDDIDGITQR
ncbi:mucin-5AC-like isoform X2 [Varroa destructor]|uniref:VWFC domain-containing protein n=1 Tax=Varroa destructor TaxID=109461 RepID=A0A7M7JMP0_VARDE|nr:mucin-5AC-like isoform X2 [Varroa destructor]